jgi:hypothetical protein
MKKLSSYLIIALSVFTIHTKALAQNANTTLSNLTAPVKINQSLLPNKTNSKDLGSSDSAWRNIFLRGALYLNGKKFINDLGAENTFIGVQSGKFITSGGYNAALGYQALYSNTTGYYNTAVGYISLYSNISGSFNTASGNGSLYSNQTGNYNTANGYYAMGNNVSGGFNVATGFEALQNNSDGYYNTATGIYSLLYNASGICNTGDGSYSLHSNTGSYNTGLGYYALANTTGAQYNTAIGFEAGDNYDNGYNNVFVGANTDVNGTGYYNDIAIGQGTLCTDVSQARFGNAATVSIGGYANWTNVSDGRVKTNIKQNVPGLAFINKLQPITYNLDLAAADKIIQYQRKDSTGKIIQATKFETDARAAKEKIVYTGFIAQDVEKAAKSLSYDFSGVDAAKNSKDLYGLRYAEFVVPLVKAVQELSKQNDSLKNDVIQQKQINANLETRLSKLEAMMNVSQSTNSQQSMSVSSASIQQNIPNPFSNTTRINYSLPQTYSSAKIIITDNKGVALKQINLSAKGNGSVNINASTLAAGAYQYSLYVDGKKIDTKQMLSSK